MPRKKKGPEDFWRNYINGLLSKFPEEGEEAPERELLEVTKEKDINDTVVTMLRLQFDIYLLSPVDDDDKAYMVHGSQNLEAFPDMTLKEALAFIKNRNKQS